MLVGGAYANCCPTLMDHRAPSTPKLYNHHLVTCLNYDWVLMRNWRRKWQPTPVFLPRESCGQRSLVGCCLWGRTKSDMTEATYHACMHWRRKWQRTPVFLPGESHGQKSLVGCPSMESPRVGHDWSDLAAAAAAALWGTRRLHY